MSNLYINILTVKTHKLAQKLAEQEGIELIIESLAIQAPQIRQILRAFKGILGVNLEIKAWQNQAKSSQYNQVLENIMMLPKTSSQALCQKWLDGLDPMIDSDPEKVLEELNEVLQSKIK